LFYSYVLSSPSIEEVVGRPVSQKLPLLLTAIIQEIIMAKPMRICDQDLIINKVMETINKQNSLAIENDILSTAKWKEFVKRNKSHQKLYDKITKLQKELSASRQLLDTDIDIFNNTLNYNGSGVKYCAYSSNRPELEINTYKANWELRQEITEEVRFAGMSGDFNPREMVADLVAKFS
jgi:hypothetical protein